MCNSFLKNPSSEANLKGQKWEVIISKKASSTKTVCPNEDNETQIFLS